VFCRSHLWWLVFSATLNALHLSTDTFINQNRPIKRAES